MSQENEQRPEMIDQIEDARFVQGVHDPTRSSIEPVKVVAIQAEPKESTNGAAILFHTEEGSAVILEVGPQTLQNLTLGLGFILGQLIGAQPGATSVDLEKTFPMGEG